MSANAVVAFSRDSPLQELTKSEILLIHSKLLVSNSKGDIRELIGGQIIRKYKTLRILVIGCSRDSIVDSLAGRISDQGQSSSGVHDCRISGLVDWRSIHTRRFGLDTPEALTVVYGSIGNIFARRFNSRLIDVAKRVEALRLYIT